MKNLFSLIALSIFCCAAASAQIVAPDTVLINTPVNFTTTYNATTYAWAADTVDALPQPGNAKTVKAGFPLNTNSAVVMVVDSGKYYAFVVNQNGGLYRFSFGTDPNSTPATTFVTNVVSTAANSQGMDIVKDGANWYGFVTNNDKLVRLNFGISLANTPTTNAMSFPTYIGYAMQISIKKAGNEWVAFVGNYANMNHIVRFDFGSSLNNTPTPSKFGSNALLDNPCCFALHQQAGNWYLLASNLTDNTLTIFSLGTNIKNNNPGGVNLGNTGGFLVNPRTVNFISGCNELHALVTNESGNIVRLSFNNGITSTPAVANLGTMGLSGTRISYTSPYWYNDTLSLLGSCFSTDAIYKFDVLSSWPAQGSVKYNDPAFTDTFTTPGSYDITLHCDQGDKINGQAFCKTVVAVTSIDTSNSIADQGLSSGISVFPNPSNGMIHITCADMNDVREAAITCYSIDGKLVYNGIAAVANGRMNTTLDLRSMPKGLYHLKISTETKSFTKRVVLE